MKRHHLFFLILIGTLCLTASLPARADEATKVLMSLYGDPLARVAKTPALDDDLTLAAEMLAVAKTSASQLSLLALLCDQVYELSWKDARGHATAVAAMKLLAEQSDADRPTALQKLQQVRTRQYTAAKREERSAIGTEWVAEMIEAAGLRETAGDWDGAVDLLKRAQGIADSQKLDSSTEIRSHLDRLAAIKRAAAQADALKEKIKKDPNNTSLAESLLQLLVVDLNRLEEARQYTFLLPQSSWARFVPMANSDWKTLSAMDLMQMGDWFNGLSRTTSGAAAARCLARAGECYRVFLEAHAGESLLRSKVEISLKSVESALNQAEAETPGLRPKKSSATTTLNLLKGLDLKQYAMAGTWSIQPRLGLVNLPDPRLVPEDEDASAPAETSILRFPALPTSSYQASFSFTRQAGEGPVMLLLPVGPGHMIGTILGHEEGKISVLFKLADEQAPQKGAVRIPGALTNNHRYELAADVQIKDDQVEIAISLDRQPYLKWSGPISQIEQAEELAFLQPRSLGILAGECTFILHSATVKATPGSLQPVP